MTISHLLLRRHGEKNKKKLDEIVETSLKQAALWDQVKDSLDKSALALSGDNNNVCVLLVPSL